MTVEAREQVERPAGPAVDIGLESLRKTYGDVVAVDGIDLEVLRGEFFTMLGPSGSGKTTTLRMIAGFETPTEGRILLGGKDVTGQPPFERDVNTVFQDYALFPHMSVGDNVAYVELDLVHGDDVAEALANLVEPNGAFRGRGQSVSRKM